MKTEHCNLRVESFTGIVFELTNQCQLRCGSCPRESALGRAMETGFMPLGPLKRLLDETGPFLKIVGLSGLGETFLYPHLREAAEYLYRRNPEIFGFISTNAYAPDCPAIFSDLSPVIRSLQISIDGVGEIFEKTRAPARYDVFLRNVEEIARIAKGRGTVLQFNMVLTTENFFQAKEVVLLAKEFGVPRVYFNPVNWVTNDRKISGYRFFKSRVFLDALEDARQLALQKGVRAETFVLDAPKDFRQCGYPWDHFYVTWDGFLVPCCAKPFPKDKHFGNVFRDGLMPCVNRNEFLWFRRMWLENITPEFCRRCHLVCE